MDALHDLRWREGHIRVGAEQVIDPVRDRLAGSGVRFDDRLETFEPGDFGFERARSEFLEAARAGDCAGRFPSPLI
jgi:hypothetical protein